MLWHLCWRQVTLWSHMACLQTAIPGYAWLLIIWLSAGHFCQFITVVLLYSNFPCDPCTESDKLDSVRETFCHLVCCSFWCLQIFVDVFVQHTICSSVLALLIDYNICMMWVTQHVWYKWHKKFGQCRRISHEQWSSCHLIFHHFTKHCNLVMAKGIDAMQLRR